MSGDLVDFATVAGRLRYPAARQGRPLDLIDYRAHISACCCYRWSLSRIWGRSDGLILPWIMLNPSTADARVDDPTLRRIIGFSWRWGFDGLLVVNLFPLRTSKPAELREWLRWDERQDWGARDDIWDNENRIASLLEPFDAAMAAWGAQPGALGYEVELAAERVLDEINERRFDRVIKLFCLGETIGGDPKHPMARGIHRVPDDASPVPLSRYPGQIVGLEKDARRR